MFKLQSIFGEDFLNNVFPFKLKYTSSILQACVCYILSNFYFSPNDSPLKTMKNVFYFI